MGQERNKFCDFLKGIAMIMVVLVHSRQRIPGISHAFNILMLGQLGCQIFFMISGYLLMRSFDLGQVSIKRFYVKKFVSIAPGYYLIIGLTFVLNTITYKYINQSIGFAYNIEPISILCNMLFLHGLLPFCNNDVVAGGWYIGTLMLMYLIFPLIYKIIVKIKNWHMAPILVALISWVVAVIFKIAGSNSIFNNSDFYYFNIIVQIPCLLWGCGIYIDAKNGKVATLCERMLGIIVILISFTCYFIAFDYHVDFLYIVMPTAFTAGIYLLAKNCFINKAPGLGKRKIDKYIIMLGENSYYIYLAHPFFVWTMPELFFKILSRLEISINVNIVYIIMLPFMFILSWLVGKLFKRICNPISKFIDEKCKVT